MTTDGVDAAMAERLARLQARRTPSATTAADTADAPDPATTEVADASGPSPRSRRPGRRHATTSKVVTVGTTATATLGLIALYGAAEQRAASASNDQPVLLPATETPPPVVPVDAAAPTTPPTPQVVVVVLDGRSASGLPAELAADPAVAAAIDEAIGGAAVPEVPVTTAAPASTGPTTDSATTIAEPAPVATPKVVDLAVPAPPRPAPSRSSGGATAPAAAPAPAPAPQATSSGS